MTMAASGVAKLIEECGELQQALGKRLAYWWTDDHPDGSNLRERIQDEMGDVLAAIDFCGDKLGLDGLAIARRKAVKLRVFWSWEDDPDNNFLAIDGQPT